MNWFRFLAKACVHGGIDLTRAPARSRARLRGQLLILTYHSFSERWQTGLMGSLPVKRFQRQLEFLSSAFHVVSLADGLRRVGEQHVANKPLLAITIDDGFGDNFSHAFPLLARHGIPATIFLATDFLDTGRLPWPTTIAAILDRTGQGMMEFPFRADIGQLRAKGKVIQAMKEAWGPLTPDARFAAIEEFARHMQVDMPGEPGPLNWDQVRKMRAAGFEFGSHTVFHSRLHESDRQIVRNELAISKARIEAELDTPCNFFAYPDGKWNECSRCEVADAGYHAGLTQDRGINGKDSDRFRLKRVEVPFDDPFASFRYRASKPHEKAAL